MVDNENNALSKKAAKNLERNKILRRKALGFDPIPLLTRSTLFAKFNAENIEVLREEVNGKDQYKFKYTIDVPSVWECDTGKRTLIVDAITSGQIDLYLAQGIDSLDIEIVRGKKGTRCKVKPSDDFLSVYGDNTQIKSRLHSQQQGQDQDMEGALRP